MGVVDAGRRVVVALIAALALAGCTFQVISPEPVRIPQPPTGDSREADERAAVGAVGGFWQRHFTEETGQPYAPPRVVGGYRGTSGPTCGGDPSVPGNAFYCTVGDFLAWDEDLMAAGYDRIGDAWVYLIIAHEWGHAVQARLARSQLSVAAELQADCLAGAALQGAVDDGLVQLEAGDEQEIARTLVAVADDFPWTDVGSHGNAQERTSAFAAGVQGGVAACI